MTPLITEIAAAYVRAEGGPRISGRVFERAPSGRLCVACGAAFVETDRSVLVVLGPGDDEEEREKCRSGRFYNAISLVVHAECAGISGDA